MTTLTAHREGEMVVLRHDHTGAARVWATVRIALGWIFLWAFLDKTFALGFSTGRAEDGTIDYLGDAAWISGASPTDGFLIFATRGPLAGFFQGFAGEGWADWLFMIGLLGIGLALILGIGIRLAAILGSTMLISMFLAALWPEHNPVVDDHIIYSLVLVGLALSNAGNTWGLGDRWERLEIVQRYPILK